MLPNYYACSACHEKFSFAFREAVYHVGDNAAVLAGRVADTDLLWAPFRPGWCKDCGALSLVEDIESLRVFEDAYAAVRSGRKVEYPIDSECYHPQDVEPDMKAYLEWRMSRRHVARALCCGGSRFQFMDVAQPLLKHQDCDFGFISAWSSISSHNGPGPGVRSAANIRLYDAEGLLVGRLTWRDLESRTWAVEPAAYPPAVED